MLTNCGPYGLLSCACYARSADGYAGVPRLRDHAAGLDRMPGDQNALNR